MDNQHLQTILRLYETKPTPRNAGEVRHNHIIKNWEFELWQNCDTINEFIEALDGREHHARELDKQFGRVTGSPLAPSIKRVRVSVTLGNFMKNLK